MLKQDFLDSVVVEELDTIPMEFLEDFESNFGDNLNTDSDDFWSTTDVVPL